MFWRGWGPGQKGAAGQARGRQEVRASRVRRLQTTCESSSNKPRDDSAVAASGNRRHPVALAVLTCQALVLQGLGAEEGELQRLLGVEPGVAVGVVAVAQRLVADGLGAADALGDVLPGQDRKSTRLNSSH